MNDNNNLKESPVVEAIWRDSFKTEFSMASDPLTCSLLRTLAAAKPSGRFLELGSGTGLSTAWILEGMDYDSSLITVDNDESFLSILRENLGHDSRLEIVCADGDDYLRSLESETFDFIFADTWSGKYRLLDETLKLLKPCGLYVIDDMLPQSNWPEGHAEKVADLIAKLEQNENMWVTKISWASGIILATKI